jgi:hypothetical protein
LISNISIIVSIYLNYNKTQLSIFSKEEFEFLEYKNLLDNISTIIYNFLGIYLISKSKN